MSKGLVKNRLNVPCTNCGSIATATYYKKIYKANIQAGIGLCLCLPLITAIVGLPLILISSATTIISFITPYKYRVKRPHVHRCLTCKHKWETSTMPNQ